MTSASKTLFKSSTARLTLFISNIIIGFLMMPFLVHSLGDEAYGVWALAVSIVSFYNLMDAGIASSLQRFLIHAIHGEEHDEASIALSTSIVLSSAIGVVILLVTLILTQFASLLVDSQAHQDLFKITLFIVGIKVAIQLPMFPYYGKLIARYRYDIISYIQLASLLTRTLIIVLAINAGYGVLAVAVASTLTSIGESLTIASFARRYEPRLEFALANFRFERLRRYYHYGKYVFLIEVSDRIQSSFDDVVVSVTIGIAAVTHYTIALALVHYFSSSIQMIFGVISPLLNKYYKLKQWDNLREVFLITTEITTSGSILLGGLILLLGKPFVTLWMGDEYADIYPALVVLCIGAMFAKTLTPGIFTLLAIAKHRYYAFISLGAALSNLALSIVLAQYLGILGVALGTLIPSLVITVILLPRYLCRQIEISVWSYYRILLRSATAGALVLVPAYLLTRDLDLANLPALILTGFLVSLIYAAVQLRFVISRNTAGYIAEGVPAPIAPIVRYLSA